MAVGTVQVTRNTGGDHAPVAVSYSTTAQKDRSLSLTLVASDADNDPLTYTFTPPHHGSLTGTAPNLIYTPSLGYIGMDSLSFIAYDGVLGSPSATIIIKVQSGYNNRPIAKDESLTVVLNTLLHITLPASDWDGDYLTYTYAQPSHGTLAGTAPNLVYTPSLDYEGYDSFDYTVSDGKDSSQATIYLKVTRLQIINLVGPQQDLTLRGDLTYFVDSAVPLNGTTTIEGGAVIKFDYIPNPTDAHPSPKLVFNGPVICKTTQYQPAIFTARDDDSVGSVLPTSFGNLTPLCADCRLRERPLDGGSRVRYPPSRCR